MDAGKKNGNLSIKFNKRMANTQAQSNWVKAADAHTIKQQYLISPVDNTIIAFRLATGKFLFQHCILGFRRRVLALTASNRHIKRAAGACPLNIA
ncbi:MAG: hypothetical protein FWG10_07410 [Eubacteriaceae bacterium]|nr:hypothetical protein [Eubacteriaceae bacterium]